jgi:epoxyqueuosine reductase
MHNLLRKRYSEIIKAEALRLGFSDCGIAKAGYLQQEASRLEHWLKKKAHGEMHYMANYFDLRLNPSLLVPGAKSVISLLMNYYPKEKQSDESLKIAKYAYGKDYHEVLKEKAGLLLNYMRENIGEINGRIFVDSAPVMEKAWAQKAGLGWIGKNSNLLTKKGSYYFLAEIISDLELDYNTQPMEDFCGTCQRCILACPTKAIGPAYSVDASKCISYFTIEYRNEIPEEYKGKFIDNIFGCDICQDICPWNWRMESTAEEAFSAHPAILALTNEKANNMTEENFKEWFKKSAVKRTKYEGLLRNIKFLSK